MRLLPRSAKGTWLLATAAWAGLCIMAWSVLPCLPRGELRLPKAVELIGFTADGESVITVDFDYSGPFRLCDVATARETATLNALRPGQYVTHFYLAPDARSLLMCAADGPHAVPPLQVLDLADGLLTELPGPAYWNPLASNVGEWPHFSADGRLLAYLCGGDGAFHYKARVYDLKARCEVFTAASTEAYALAPDGKTLAVGAEDWSNEIVVYDIGSRRPVRHIPTGNSRALRMSYSPDGAVIAAQSRTDDGQFVLRLWRADGRGQLPTPHETSEYEIDRYGRVIAELPGEGTTKAVTAVSAAGATVRRTVRFQLTPEQLSPDGGIALFPFRTEPPAWAKWLAGFNLLAASRLDAWSDRGRLVDTVTGDELGTIGGSFAPVWWGGRRRVATLSADQTSITIWDIPPRKPLAWFALGAGILALPIAWLGRRRVRSLRREAA